MVPKKIAVFASGTGSNALNIINYFKDHPGIQVGFVLSNRADAPVLAAAAQQGVATLTLNNTEVSDADVLIRLCEEQGVDGIVLAGFLRKIPEHFVSRYENRILNIHPSLLPKYGGEGMYGNFVHQAVLANREMQTGITIHWVNTEYDKGEVVAQFTCELDENESIESIREKIHALEMMHFPKVIEQAF